MKLVFTPAAASDIDQIWNYTARQWSVEQAEKYVDEIESNCLALASGDKSGRKADIRPGYFKCRSGKHIIYYRQQGETLEVVRILHEQMDTNRHL